MQTEFKIDKGVPLRPKADRYPLRAMKVGDSFFASDKSLRNNIYNCARNLGVKVTARLENNGLRVWRIK